MLKKIISVLINTFINHEGIDQWPHLFNYLLANLSEEKKFEISIETLQIILEDSGSFMEIKSFKVIKK